MRNDFDEDLQSEHRDRLDAQSQDFDWSTLYRRLNEEAAESDIDKQTIEAVIRLLRLLVVSPKQQIRPDHIGLRTIALAWLLNPGYFADSPSLRELARRCGVDHPRLAELTGQFSRVLGWRNRAQRRAWNWRHSDRRT